MTTLVLGFPHPVLRQHRVGRHIARALSWTWGKCGIDRATERTYAAAVIAVSGGWLAAAIGYGPTPWS